MQAVSLAGLLVFLFATSSIGLRLLWLWIKTRELPELTLAYDEVQRENGIEVRDGTSMQANGITMTFTITCGQFVNTTGTAQYTATATQFMILPPNGVLRVYTKQ